MSDEEERMDVEDEQPDEIVEEEDEDQVDEDDDEEEEEEEVALGPAALGLHRVGTKLPPKRISRQPMQALNARGMPARLRKKKNFYDDEQEDVKPNKNSPIKRGSSSLKGLKRANSSKHLYDDGEEDEEGDDNDDLDYPSTSTSTVARVKKERDPENVLNFDTMSENEILLNTELVGRRLKNLLKLPKAHKFVMFEWFYSNLDQVLFKGENDFQVCLRDTFPQLAARQLSRFEWGMIRRMMGKPRRCSQVQFDTLLTFVYFFH